jgi:hypothetical protein
MKPMITLTDNKTIIFTKPSISKGIIKNIESNIITNATQFTFNNNELCDETTKTFDEGTDN